MSLTDTCGSQINHNLNNIDFSHDDLILTCSCVFTCVKYHKITLYGNQYVQSFPITCINIVSVRDIVSPTQCLYMLLVVIERVYYHITLFYDVLQVNTRYFMV